MVSCRVRDVCDPTMHLQSEEGSVRDQVRELDLLDGALGIRVGKAEESSGGGEEWEIPRQL